MSLDVLIFGLEERTESVRKERREEEDGELCIRECADESGGEREEQTNREGSSTAEESHRTRAQGDGKRRREGERETSSLRMVRLCNVSVVFRSCCLVQATQGRVLSSNRLNSFIKAASLRTNERSFGSFLSLPPSHTLMRFLSDVIATNILVWMHTLISAVKKLDLKWGKEENRDAADKILNEIAGMISSLTHTHILSLNFFMKYLELNCFACILSSIFLHCVNPLLPSSLSLSLCWLILSSDQSLPSLEERFSILVRHRDVFLSLWGDSAIQEAFSQANSFQVHPHKGRVPSPSPSPSLDLL